MCSTLRRLSVLAFGALLVACSDPTGANDKKRPVTESDLCGFWEFQSPGSNDPIDSRWTILWTAPSGDSVLAISPELGIFQDMTADFSIQWAVHTMSGGIDDFWLPDFSTDGGIRSSCSASLLIMETGDQALSMDCVDPEGNPFSLFGQVWAEGEGELFDPFLVYVRLQPPPVSLLRMTGLEEVWGDPIPAQVQLPATLPALSLSKIPSSNCF